MDPPLPAAFPEGPHNPTTSTALAQMQLHIPTQVERSLGGSILYSRQQVLGLNLWFCY